MVFAMYQYESTIGIHVSPPPELPPTFLSNPSLTDHWLWVPCFMHQTGTDCLLYIW